MWVRPLRKCFEPPGAEEKNERNLFLSGKVLAGIPLFLLKIKMLSDQELQNLCESCGVSENGISWIKAIRNNPPARRVRSSKNSIPCRFPSIKMGQTIQAESHTVELSAIYLMEHDENVLEYWDQPNPPLDLNYFTAKGKTIRTPYTPDFLVISTNFVGFEEWKPKTKLVELVKTQSTRYVAEQQGYRSPPVEVALAGTGLGYRIRTDAELNPVLISNLKFMSYYLKTEINSDSLQESKAKLATLFKPRAWMSLSDLINAWSPLPVDRLYEAIVSNHAYIDMEHEDIAAYQQCRVYQNEVVYQHYRGHLAQNDASRPAQAASHSLILGASPESLERATNRAQHLQRIRDGEPLNIVADCAGVDVRTLRRWQSAFDEAEREHGNGFLGLLTRLHERGNRASRLPPPVLELTHEIINTHFVNAKRKNPYQVYGQLLLACESQQLQPPGKSTFYEMLDGYRRQEITAVREGGRAAYQQGGYESLELDTPVVGFRAKRIFEQCEIDHTLLDIELVSERSGVNLGRPWFTLIFDDYSRRALGFYLTFDPPSYRSVMAVIRDMVRRHERFPEALLVDGGKEFESLYFEQLVAQHQCIPKSRKGKPRFGAHLERYFGATTTELLHNLVGNTQATKIGRQMTKQNDPKRVAAWTLQSLNRAIDGYLDVYDQRAHPDLGCSLLESFERSRTFAGERPGRRVPYDATFQISSLPATPRGTVTLRTNKPVQIHNVEYWHPSFRNASLDGQKVPARYDPFDLGVAYVFLHNTWLKCQAVLYESFRHRSEKELQLATEEYRRVVNQNQRSKSVNLKRLAQFISGLEQQEQVLIEAKQQTLRESKKVMPTLVLVGGSDTKTPKKSVNENASSFSWGFDAPIPEDFQ